MRKVNRTWMAVVAAALVLGTLVGVVWARPSDRPGSAESTRKVTLPGAVFIPTGKMYDWSNDGLKVWCSSGSCYWAAPVVFPTLSSVTVERVKLHVYDNNGAAYACATVYRASPAGGSMPVLGGVCSPFSGATSNPETFTSAAINKAVWPSHGAIVWLTVDAPDIYVYGVTVEYHRNM